jgi:hypothetical protein
MSVLSSYVPIKKARCVLLPYGFKKIEECHLINNTPPRVIKAMVVTFRMSTKSNAWHGGIAASDVLSSNIS